MNMKNLSSLSCIDFASARICFSFLWLRLQACWDWVMQSNSLH